MLRTVIVLWALVMTDVSFGIQENRYEPTHELPVLLQTIEGEQIKNSAEWEARRREEVLELFEDHVYGSILDNSVAMEAVELSRWDSSRYNATGREIELRFSNKDQHLTTRLLIYTPQNSKAVPCFVGLNFHGNHTAASDEQIAITDAWVRNDSKSRAEDNRANEQGRGSSASRWPVKEMIERGIAVATMYYGELDPDFDDGFQNGVHSLFGEEIESIPERQRPGSFGAWAWGLSRILDYLEKDPQIDAKRVAVVGHSRLGKTALWAGASDPRFAMVVSNNSGCGGAALHRRDVGESVARINKVFPHWFCDQFADYSSRVDEIPVDQHMLIALMAPRPVYVASASEDTWADPVGEFLSMVRGSAAFELYGNPPFPNQFPSVGENVHIGRMGYHVREGRHDITLDDWSRFAEFFNHNFENKK